jgi:nicotinate-nucleotide adenylyltransferase
VHLAVFGGSFDPPHNGHLALCLFARELLDIDRLLVSVSNNPFKQNRGAEDVHRIRMAELLSQEINRTGVCSEVSRWEIEKKQPSYTVDLLRYLRVFNPADRFTLLVGEDSFKEFTSWKEYEQLFSLCDIVVFSRASMQCSLPPYGVIPRQGAVQVIDFTAHVSSTAIRDQVASGHSISRLVPSSVQRYIAEHGLYLQKAVSATSTQALKRRES